MQRLPLRLWLAAALGVASIATIACGGAENVDGALDTSADATPSDTQEAVAMLEAQADARSAAVGEFEGDATVGPMACPITGCEGDPEDPPPPPPPPPPTYNIGVIPATPSCPPGATYIQIKMDDENVTDTVDRYSKLIDWVGATTQDTASTRNTIFRFCKLSDADSRKFKPLIDESDGTGPLYNKDYAVLKLGDRCPNGSKEFRRHIDNEDHEPVNNWNTGNILPNYQDSNTKLFFCLFRYGTNGITKMQEFPALGFSYGVFASHLFDGTPYPKGTIITADEYDGNWSYFEWPDTTISTAAVNYIISGTAQWYPSTTLRVAEVRTY